MSHEEYHVT